MIQLLSSFDYSGLDAFIIAWLATLPIILAFAIIAITIFKGGTASFKMEIMCAVFFVSSFFVANLITKLPSKTEDIRANEPLGIFQKSNLSVEELSFNGNNDNNIQFNYNIKTKSLSYDNGEMNESTEAFIDICDALVEQGELDRTNFKTMENFTRSTNEQDGVSYSVSFKNLKGERTFATYKLSTKVVTLN